MPVFIQKTSNGDTYSSTMPENTRFLVISSYTRFKKLPFSLPDSLKKIVCSNNELEELPHLPEGLEELDCNTNALTSLTLPRSLINLNCNYNKLTFLELPSQLKKLDCGSNPLIRIPELPDSLEELSCISEIIKEKKLPKLPPMLRVLQCNHTGLEVLPPLPESLLTLWCHNNRLTVLPRLPLGLRNLSAQNNPWEEPFATYILESRDTPSLIQRVNRHYDLKQIEKNTMAFNETIGASRFVGNDGKPYNNPLTPHVTNHMRSFLAKGVNTPRGYGRNSSIQRLIHQETTSRGPGSHGPGPAWFRKSRKKRKSRINKKRKTRSSV